MRGKVIAVNLRKGLFAVLIDDGGCSVVEIVDTCEVELGDLMVGQLDTLGRETLRNETRTEDVDVCIQDIHRSSADAQTQVHR